MMLNDITKAVGAHKRRKRVGRGESSGWGKTCTRGNKGCQARAGGGVRPLTEGGQMPIFRRLPKRGFNNAQFARAFEIVNLVDLERHFSDGDTVDAGALSERGLVRSGRSEVKILGHGKLSKKVTVRTHAISAKARALIEQAGGQVQLIEATDAADKARAKRLSKKGQAGKPAAKAKPVAKAERGAPGPDKASSPSESSREEAQE